MCDPPADAGGSDINMNKKTIKDIDISGKRVFIRVDFNARRAFLEVHCVDEALEPAADALATREILLLQNIQLPPPEEKDEPDFANHLASLCDVYGKHPRATAHRVHASREGMRHF